MYIDIYVVWRHYKFDSCFRSVVLTKICLTYFFTKKKKKISMISTPISSITFNYTISNDFLQPHLVSLTTLSRLLYMVKQTAKTNSSSVMCANCLMICHTDDRMVEKYTTIYTMIMTTTMMKTLDFLASMPKYMWQNYLSFCQTSNIFISAVFHFHLCL